MKNRMEGMMSNEWKMVLLGDVCTKASSNISLNKVADGLGEYPLFGASGFAKNINFYHQEKEYIAIVKDGAGVGRVMMLPPKSSIVGTMQYLLPKSNIYINYLCYILKQLDLTKYASGATIPHIYFKDYSKEDVFLPPIAKQREIAAVLDKASELVEKRKAQLAELDRLAESIFYDMFGDPVTNEKGWDMKTIEKLVVKNKNAIKRGPFGGALKKEIFVEDGYLVYEQFHALNNDFSFGRYYINEKKYKELIGFAVVPNDIIISCSGVNLGKLAVIPDNSAKGIINQALLKITLNNEIITNSLFVKIFTNENFKDKYFGYNRGCAIPNFPPMSDFKQFQFICPPLSLQQQFAVRIEKIEEQKAKVKEALKESENLFQRLMQDMFNPECHN